MVALAGLFFFLRLNRTRQITVSRNLTPLIAPGAIFIPNSDSEQMIGNPGAAITVVEFVDLDCARCASLHLAAKEFVQKHPQDVRLVWKDIVKPTIFSDYTLAHQAAYCAGKQNKFWEFVDIAMANRNNLAEAGLKKIALNLNINIEPWWICVNGAEAKQAIANSTQMANQLGIKSLPAIFVNNKLINTDKEVNITDMLTNFIKKP